MIPSWAVFISGRGSNLQSLLSLQNIRQIKLVISNKKNAAGVFKARRFGIPVIFLEKNFSYEEVLKVLKSYKITHIFLLGFMKIIPADFIKNCPPFLLNLHPSLLPLHKGLHAIENSFADKNSDMGISIHYVNEFMDEGELILQRRVVAASAKTNLETDSFKISRSEQYWIKQLFLKWNLNAKI